VTTRSSSTNGVEVAIKMEEEESSVVSISGEMLVVGSDSVVTIGSVSSVVLVGASVF
jgi:hypothetical protein